MTLPFSDKPEKSSIYQDVKTETLQELTPDQFDTFKARMFAEGVNGLEDEYRRLLLLGLASDKISISGPMPGTARIQKAETTSSGTRVTAFQPDVGEVWQMYGAVSTSATGLSGTVFVEVLIRERATGNQSEIISTSTTSGTLVPATEITHNPIFIDENTELVVEASGTFTLMDFAIPLIRVR